MRIVVRILSIIFSLLFLSPTLALAQKKDLENIIVQDVVIPMRK